jgi:hypothetical protein
MVSEETMSLKQGGKCEQKDKTYTKAVLESLTSNGQGLEQFGNGLAAGLRVARRTSRRALRGCEVGDALSGGNGDVGPSHGD